MGAETGLQVGEDVEALKTGRFFKDTWIPSMWKKAKVVAANYDGTYDLQFEMNHGPYRERRRPKATSARPRCRCAGTSSSRGTRRITCQHPSGCTKT
ncbi:unnamed protein product [Effrenium voratum]|nr:unnamed protein product [Effrenium voratum]